MRAGVTSLKVKMSCVCQRTKDKTYISVAFSLQPFLTCRVAITLYREKHKIALETVLRVTNRMRLSQAARLTL